MVREKDVSVAEIWPGIFSQSSMVNFICGRANLVRPAALSPELPRTCQDHAVMRRTV